MLHYQIGGIKFTCPSCRTVPSQPRWAHKFYHNEPCPAFDEILVTRRDGIPERKESEQIFTSKTWSVLRDKQAPDTLYIHTGFMRYAGRFWACKCNADFRSIELFHADGTAPDDGDLASALSYPLDEILVLYRLNSDSRGVIVHSAGGSIQGRGIVFPGVSGAGKSTLADLLEPRSGNRLFTDDRSVLRQDNGKWHAYGTPWPGDSELARNERVPLEALVFHTQAERTEIRPMSIADGMRRLLPTCSIPWFDKKGTQRGLDICERILQDIPLYELLFTPDQTAADAVEEFAASLQ